MTEIKVGTKIKYKGTKDNNPDGWDEYFRSKGVRVDDEAEIESIEAEIFKTPHYFCKDSIRKDYTRGYLIREDFEVLEEPQFKKGDIVQNKCWDYTAIVLEDSTPNICEVQRNGFGQDDSWKASTENLTLLEENNNIKVGDSVKSTGKGGHSKLKSGSPYYFVKNPWKKGELNKIGEIVYCKNKPYFRLIYDMTRFYTHDSWEKIIENNKVEKVNKNCSEIKLEVKEKMEKPKTKLEKDACELAMKETIEKTIKAKSEGYKNAMTDFISIERSARNYRKQADKRRELLGITDKDMEALF